MILKLEIITIENKKKNYHRITEWNKQMNKKIIFKNKRIILKKIIR